VTPGSTLHNLSDKSRVDLGPNDSFHHCEMFKVVMCLEEGVSGEELNQDTTNTPNITRETPSQVEYNFGGAIMASRNNRGMILVIEGRRTKVDQSDLAVEKDTPLSSIAGICVGGRGDGTVIGKGLVGVANEEDIFGFEVGMDEVEVMKD